VKPLPLLYILVSSPCQLVHRSMVLASPASWLASRRRRTAAPPPHVASPPPLLSLQ
jgi:hypothetical protein